ncbi:hypothetical protein HDU99_002763, partial [Rhizoclosmatium hyalinum]
MLMVYAFCNIHDISWGTKGQDQTSSAPAVMTTLNKKGKQVTTTDVPAPDYANELIKLQEMAYEVKNPHAVVENAAPRKSSEDHFKSYRTMSQDHANHAVHVEDEISVSPPTSSPSGSDQTAPFDEFLRATTPAVGQPHAYYQPAPNPATPFYQHPRGIAGIGHSIAQSLARSARSTASSLTRRSSAQPPIPPATPYFYYPWTNYNQPPYMMPSVPPHPQSAYGGTTSVATSGIQMGSLSRDENGDSMLRRHIQMIKQDVELTNGEFILDIPLSREYVESVCETGDEEFTHLRYTACTKKADDFAEYYTLRQQVKGRQTKIAVVCTMWVQRLSVSFHNTLDNRYNEDDQLLTKTMSAVMDNIAYLCSMKGRKGWDQDSWKDIVVVLISD